MGAVQKSLDGQFVYVATEVKGNMVAKRKPVVPGKTYNGMTEIKQGLSPGDKVITTGFQNIVEGDYLHL